MTRAALRRFLLSAPVLWIGALLAATFIASRVQVGVLAYTVSAAVYQVGSILCHQRPERSFHLWGAQLPVCARCTGLYGGAALAAFVAVPMGQTFPRRVWHHARVLLLVAAIPTASTLLYEWTTGAMPSHWVRAAAGFPLGVVVMLIVLAATTSISAVEIN